MVGLRPEGTRGSVRGSAHGTAPGKAGGFFLGLLCLFSLLLFPAPEAWAENRSTVELELYDSVNSFGDGNWTHTGGGLAVLRLDQIRNDSVRSQFELSAYISPVEGSGTTPGLSARTDIGTAYAKFRFGSYRGILGKAPFSWGEGLIFNAADEIFGSSIATNLMQSSFDDSSAWITGLTWYAGPFSFIEILMNPGPASQSGGSAEPAAIEETRIGARMVGKVFGLKIESGYLFDGRNGTAGNGALQDGAWYHRPYLSLQGNLLVDWHLSASLEFPDRDHRAEDAGSALWEGMLYTAGVYSVIPAGYDDSFSFRVEARLHPAGEWKEDHIVENPLYGLYGYGEAAWDFGGGFSLLLRSLVNPVDLSTRISPGLNWNVFQGFNFLSFATIQTGENGDSYPWEAGEDSTAESPGLGFLAGCSVTY
jgi:hypothetical protein